MVSFIHWFLGTEVDQHSAIDGGLIEYPLAARDRVLAATDRREGYDPTRSSRLSGYLRTTCEARRADTGEFVACEAYLSNPDPTHIYRVPDSLSPTQRAKVLINATPKDGRGERDLGFYYLEDTRRALRESGVVDAVLEELADAILRLEGPWRSQLVPSSFRDSL